MRMIWVRRVVCAAITLAAGQALWAQTAPTINIPAEALKGTLDAANLKLIDGYTDFYAKQLATAKADDVVLAARDALVKGYEHYDSADYRLAYAQSAAKQVLPVFDIKDALKNVRLANAGQVISRMPQPSLRPVLEKMVVHAEPGVRYFGWVTFREIRPSLLAQSKDVVAGFYQLLAQQMAKETCPPVLAAMVDVANLGTADTTAADAAIKKLADEQSYAIVMANWPRFVQGIAPANGVPPAGSAAMASVCRDGSGALAYFATVFEGDKARRKAILQAMVDVLWAGAVTYDITFKALEKADARSRTEGEARLEILSNMMQSVEGALSGVTGKTTLRVQKALSGQKPAQRGTDAQLAVLDWVEKDLKADGVVEPKLPAPVSTAPASSAPASRSAK